MTLLYSDDFQTEFHNTIINYYISDSEQKMLSIRCLAGRFTQPCVAINLNKSSTDMAKLQIKQEKYIYLKDYFLSLPDFEKLIDGRQPRKDYRHFF